MSQKTQIARKGISKTTSPQIQLMGLESSTDNETEEEMDPWIPLIEEAKQRSNIAFEE
jgi:hypothetical protein